MSELDLPPNFVHFAEDDNGDGCSAECIKKEGFRCTGEPSVCEPYIPGLEPETDQGYSSSLIVDNDNIGFSMDGNPDKWVYVQHDTAYDRDVRIADMSLNEEYAYWDIEVEPRAQYKVAVSLPGTAPEQDRAEQAYYTIHNGTVGGRIMTSTIVIDQKHPSFDLEYGDRLWVVLEEGRTSGNHLRVSLSSLGQNGTLEADAVLIMKTGDALPPLPPLPPNSDVVFLDNSQPEFSFVEGSCPIAAGGYDHQLPYGGGDQYRCNEPATVQWVFSGLTPGRNYDFGTFFNEPGDHYASNALFSIHNGSQVVSTPIDQTEYGIYGYQHPQQLMAWHRIGIVTAQGDTITVQLESTGANGIAVADVVASQVTSLAPTHPQEDESEYAACHDGYCNDGSWTWCLSYTDCRQ